MTAFLVMLVVATCAGTSNQPSPSPTPDWAVRSVDELGAILADPAAATDCELKSARSCDSDCTTAAEALRDKGDPAAVPVLVAAVKDPDTYRDAAAIAWEALEKIGGTDVIAFLVESITTWEPSEAIPGRAERADTAAGILGRIGGVEHNLVLAESTYAACQNNGFTDALVAINQADATPLLELLTSFETIEVYGPLIRIGQPGTEKALLAAFRENGYEDMAECFLNSGNPKLVKAAQQWAADRGAWTLGVKAGELWGPSRDIACSGGGDVGWYGRSLKARLGIGLGIVAVLAAGLAALFLATGGAELLFGPTVPVTFATIDAQPDFRRVTLTGELSLPATMPMDGGTHSVYLSDPANPGRSVGVSIRVAQAGATAAPNQMDELPLIYSDDDLRVRLASGSSAHHGDLVRVTGPVRTCTAGGEPLRCIDAELIESGE